MLRQENQTEHRDRDTRRLGTRTKLEIKDAGTRESKQRHKEIEHEV
jgi:hypothetical protein